MSGLNIVLKAIEGELAKYLPPNAKFYLWIDRQKRPTVGATVHKGVGTNRQEIGQSTFMSMLEALKGMIQSLIPQYLEEVFLTFSTGSWQRSRQFHIKIHLTTAAFLSLTDCLLSKGGHPKKDSFLCIKDELEKREKIDNHARQLQEMFSKSSACTEWHSDGTDGKLHVATVNELDYPLLCIYQDKSGSKTTAVSTSELPHTLDVLEKFVKESWGQAGFSIGMVFSKSSSDSSSSCYQIAAIVEEGAFAYRVKKSKQAIEVAWGWKEPDRDYYKK